MERSILQRVRLLFEEKSINANKFGNGNESAVRRYQRQLKGESALSLDFVLDIIVAFEDISAEWLLRGKGEMLQPIAKQSAGYVSGNNIYGVNIHEREIHIKCPDEYGVLLEIIKKNNEISAKYQAQLDKAQLQIDELISLLKAKL